MLLSPLCVIAVPLRHCLFRHSRPYFVIPYHRHSRESGNLLNHRRE
ncbi:MAG: hypothetical protein ACR2P4_04855 [Gammaproteobacteria bacterium]